MACTGALCKNLVRPKVLVTHSEVPQVALDILKKCCEVIVNEELPTPTRQQIFDKAKGVDGIFFASHTTLDKEMIEAVGPQLKMVATMSVGYDHIDVQELKKRGILISNTPGVLTDAVADIAIMLTLAASRRLHEGRKHIEDGTWRWGVTWMLGQDINNSTVGIIGFGGVGAAIAKRLKAFNVAEILYSGHRDKPEGKALGAKFVSQDELLTRSDFVIVSAPLTNETRGLFDDATFKKMKRTAVFVNVARGGIVNQDALYRALKDGTIFSAGLDVMTPEPLPKDDPLLSLPNCVLIPHLGSATIKTRNAMAELAANNLLKGLNGEELLTPIRI